MYRAHVATHRDGPQGDGEQREARGRCSSGSGPGRRSSRSGRGGCQQSQPNLRPRALALLSKPPPADLAPAATAGAGTTTTATTLEPAAGTTSNAESGVALAAESFKSQDYLKMLAEIMPELETSAPGGLASKAVPSLKSVVMMSDKEHSGAFRWETMGMEFKNIWRI